MPADFLRLSRLLSLSAENRPITNIGAAGTDFSATGGLTLADVVTIPNGVAATPGLRVTLDQTGLFSAGAALLGVSLAGNERFRFTATGFIATPGNTVEFSFTNPGANRVLTIPDPGAAANVILSEGNQQINGMIGLGTAAVASRPLTIGGTLANPGAANAGLSVYRSFSYTSAATGHTNREIYVEGNIAAANTQNWTATVGLRGTEALINLSATGNAYTLTGAAVHYVGNLINKGSAIVTSLWGIYFEDLTGGSSNYYFRFPIDATDPTGGGGAATGRIPVDVGGVLRYLAYY